MTNSAILSTRPKKWAGLVDFVIAFFAGAICVVAWEPFAVSFVGIVAYAVLFFLLLSAHTLLRASLISMSFATALHTLGHGWIFDSLINQAHTGLVFALIGSSIFIAYLAVFTVVPSVVFFWWQRRFTFEHPKSQGKATQNNVTRGWVTPLMFAACIALGEFARSLFFNGFTSLSLGYAFVNSTMKGWIPVFGTYGVSFLALSISASIAFLLHRRAHFKVKTTFLPPMVFTVIALAGGMIFQSVHWVRSEGEAISFRLIQGNVQQKDKFDASKLDEQVARYVDTISLRPSSLIVTPETSLPLYASQVPTNVWERLSGFSNRTQSHVFLGIAALASNSDGYNSIFHIAPNQSQVARYDKVTLMPFGEYSPLGFDWFTKKLSIALKDLSQGSKSQAPFEVKMSKDANSVVRIGSIICHEDLRGQDLSRWLPQANILINPSNLSWFDGSIALKQRIQIVQARALESGRPILRVANTGITAHINHLGSIVDQLPLGHEGELSGLVQGQTGLTPYARYGDMPVMIILLLIIIYSLFSLKFIKI